VTALKYLNDRIFPRYKLDLEFVLDLAGKKVDAKLTDLSVDGFGIFVNGNTESSVSPVKIRIASLDIQATGEIVWSRNHASGTSLGIRRTGPLTGNMRNFRPSDLLLGIQKAGRTGVLRMVTPLSSKYIYFSNGKVVFVTSDNEDRDVSESLLYSGKISSEQFDRSIGFMSEAGKKQVAALLELGYIKPDEIVPALHHQAEKVLMSLLTLDEGGFIFKEGQLAPEKLLSNTFNITDLIYQGTKNCGDPEKISNLCKGIGPIVCLNSEADDYVCKIRLDEREKGVIRFLDRERTISEVLSMSPLDEPETLRMIYALHSVQVLETIETGHDNNVPDEEQAPAMGERELEAVHKIEKLYDEYRSLGYYGVLDVRQNAPLEDIKRAYYRMAREFHPDRHLYISFHSAKEKLNVIFSYINEAYQALIASQHNQQDVRGGRTGEGDVPYKHLARQKFETGMNLLRSADHEQALTFFGQATNLDASIPAYHYYYGLELFRNKKLRDAEASMRRASRLDPYNAVYMAELGHIYLVLGFNTRAKNAFEKALKNDPSNQSAAEGLKKCEQ
jgi:curved DNA-binding protein CbpA